MNPLAIITKFVPDDVVRAKVLAIVRHGAQLVSGIILARTVAFLMSKGVDQTNATLYASAIATGVGSLIVSVAMAAYALLDVNKVSKKIDTAVTVAAATSPNPESAKADALAALKVRS